MQTLSAKADASEYIRNNGAKCKLGRYVVTVGKYVKESKSGSWERGFKWTTTTYGYLSRTRVKLPTLYSGDHGVTWYDSYSIMKKERAGKVKLDVAKYAEFSFDAIQKINRAYDPTYRWKP